MIRIGRGIAGFTLVELLVVIGIIALLIAILLPALNGARRNARDVQCASNIRQLSTALVNYAQEWKGKFPPNVNAGGLDGVNPAVAQEWYDVDRLGKYLPNAITYLSSGVKETVGGTVFICPEDASAGRSYSMNIWASSAADKSVRLSPNGTLWGQMGVREASNMILVTEKYSGFSTDGFYAAPSTVGFQGAQPGVRFGGKGGLPPFAIGRFAGVVTEIDYSRHRRKIDGGSGTEPRGRLNIGFADGHVAMRSHGELYDPDSGLSRYEAIWSPKDRQLEP